ncbi:MAG: class I SAM-dependent methyltransferase [Burkholderiales bacterium]|nr:class I SAM-dependent methyltransferase [Burkholderiales bacterium]
MSVSRCWNVPGLPSGSEPVRPDRRRWLRAGTAAGTLALLPGGVADVLALPVGPTGARLAAGTPSSTALGAAVQRAVHQIVDHPRVLDDPLAVKIVGAESAAMQAAVDRRSRGLRAYVAMRSRHAEDRLAEAVARGVRQYVLLGAGLDTFGCRNPHEASGLGLRVFEVDHPATQAWKRGQLAAAGIVPPPSLTFVPVDFETQRLEDRLRDSGFDPRQPAFFSMLGVVVYLTEDAMNATLRFVASCATGSGITFSFTLPPSRLGGAALASRERSMAAMAALGEPWLTFLEPETVPGRLLALGFGTAAVLTSEQANRRYFGDRADGLRVPASSHMADAGV